MRELTAVEHQRLGIAFVGATGDADFSKMKPEMTAEIVSQCVTDGEGKSVFTAADVEILGERSASVIQKVVDVCFELSGLSQKGVEDVKGG